MRLISTTLVIYVLACVPWLSLGPDGHGGYVLGADDRKTHGDGGDSLLTLGVVVHPRVPEGRRVIGELLQIGFDKHPDITTLERQAIDAVLNEIEFGLFFDDGGLSRRIDASRLLDADALVLVRPSSVNREALRVVVVEAGSGIRLLTHTVAADTDLELAAETLVEVIKPRLDRLHTHAQHLIAVPAFVDKRLVRGGDPLGDRLAELARGRLDRESGLRLIEVGDAEALGLEMKLRGEGRLGDRGTPLYLLGEISGDPTQAGLVNLSLRIERSAEVLSRRSAEKLRPSEAARYCLDTLPEMLKEATDLESSRVGASEESVRLLNRADTFLRAGDTRQAFELLQVAHLLDPDNTSVTARSLSQLRTLVWQVLFDETSGVAFEERAQASFDLYQTGLEQVRRELEASLFAPGSRRRAGVPMQQLMQYMIYADQKFLMRYSYSGVSNTERRERFLAEEIRPKVYEARRVLKDAMLKRLMELAAAGDVGGREDDMAWFFIDVGKYGETAEQETAWRFEAIKALQDAPNFERAASRFLQSNGLTVRIDHAEGMVPRLKELSPKASRFLQAHFNQQEQGRRKPVRQAKKPQAEPPVIDKDAARVEPLVLRVTQPKTRGARRVQPKGWLDCGEHGELLWHDTELFLVTGPETIRSLYLLDVDDHFWLDPTRESELCTPAYDGRYVWTAMPIAEPQLIIIDPKDGTAYSFDKDSGLPPMDGGVSVAALGPGRALVTASFGTWQNLRAWSAIVTFTPGEGISIDVFREATSVADAADAGKGLKPFYTGESIALTDPNDPQNIVVLVDQPRSLDRMWHVSTQKLLVWPNQKRSRLWHTRDGISEGLIFTTLLDGKLYHTGPEVRAGKQGAHLMSFDMQTHRMRSERPMREGEGFLSAAKHGGLYWVLGLSNRHDVTLFVGTDLLSANEPVCVLGNIGLQYEKVDKIYGSRFLGLVSLRDISNGYDVARVIPSEGLIEKVAHSRPEQEQSR